MMIVGSIVPIELWSHDTNCQRQLAFIKSNFKNMYEIEKCQKIKIDQGFFYLGLSDKKKSVGYLELIPKTSLALHNRTAGIEKLTQIKGSCSMILYDSDEGKIVKLNEKDKIEIKPAGTWHIHCNPYDKISLTYWDFAGDIRNIIEGIRKSG